MPAYDYYCSSCEKKFEVRMSISELDNKSVVCPVCGFSSSIRLVSLGMRFIMGEGVYTNAKGQQSLGDPDKLLNRKH